MTLRVAYLKCGDVAGEAARYFATGSRAETSGPDAFTHSVLDAADGAPVLLLGAHGAGARWESGHTEVIDYGAGFARSPLRLPRDLPKVVRRILRFTPDIVICGAPGPLFWAAFLAARLSRARLVYCQHVRLSSAEGGAGRRLRKGLDRLLVRRADAVLAHGPYLEAQLREAGVEPARIRRFELGFGPALEAPAERLADGRYVLFVGRLEQLKGVFELFEACVPLLRADADLRLRFAGDGAAAEALRARVAASPVAKQVELLGALPHEEVAGLMRGAEVVVTPTRSAFPEGRCMAALEALACGAPVIAPDFGPFPYVVEDGRNGLLYEPDAVPALQAALARVLEDETLRTRLRRGARSSGEQLRRPQRRFIDALVSMLGGSAAPGGDGGGARRRVPS